MSSLKKIRTFVEVTDIAKIVRKKIRLQMKTHIRDNHAEYRKIETSGLNPKRFEPKNVTNLQMKTYIRDNHAEF